MCGHKSTKESVLCLYFFCIRKDKRNNSFNKFVIPKFVVLLVDILAWILRYDEITDECDIMR